ncbi:hypothetical protein Gasu_43000 isoform 2 [Galdieria sulphuraria]|uniref:K Homology domain-containing protein n=1 Tax=Galdieria sulphuraria TaxID=130081 RepID=M2VXV8_GALSU|nr:hypothetical protein Gasu_43000 isoform 1 [Galdieria sulphuraria]XP_005704652.1 hypothetical protein Gasu_43000 isoform 2 [Galdieria sulphuraria]EME28131.1 hypothetical protein Gasu_43000 isoform 1 [Galdieria sulphuraria]EME28132.1 hypothetical protein Gasu_43000 isoform 2 [Galdieria sulphuraria]|eukprot:XP_005704651.1 hypothetical protein isoform 1 [Galdieria sulphuraria]
MSKVRASDKNGDNVDSGKSILLSQETRDTVYANVEENIQTCKRDESIKQTPPETTEQRQLSQKESVEYQDTRIESVETSNNTFNRAAPDEVALNKEGDNHVSMYKIEQSVSSEMGENPDDIKMDFIEVPKEAVGFIIGKGGETIKELSMKSGAYMEVERRDIDASSANRLFRIQGISNHIQLAKQLILEKVAGVLVGQSVCSVTSVGSIQSELWIPMDRVGVIIGIGGQTIKSLEEQSQTTIVVHNEKVNALGEKLVTIVGKPQEVHIAEMLIQEIIQKPSRVMNATLYSPVMGQTTYPGLVSPELSYLSRTSLRPMTNKTIFVPRKSIGMIIGKRGETIRDLQYRSGASIRVVPDNEVSVNTVERPIIVSGSLESVELAHNLINDIVNEGIERLGGDLSESKTLYPSASISLRIQIPNDKVGWLIGKSGSTIRELQQRSGARIQVAKPSETDIHTRSVTITGPPPFVEIAKQLIAEKLAGYYMRQSGYPSMNIPHRRLEQESELPVAAYGSPIPNYTYEMNPYASTFDPTMYYPIYGMVYTPPTTTTTSSFTTIPHMNISQDMGSVANVPPTSSVEETNRVVSSSPFPT